MLVGAGDIHSAVRQTYYRKEGPPSWQGVMLWRGATDWSQFLSGRSMYIGGGMGAKLALYPIAPGERPDTRLTNWAIAVEVADAAVSPPPKDSWSRVGRMDDVVPYSRRFKVPGVERRGFGAGNGDLLRVSDVRPRSAAALELRPGGFCSATRRIRCTR